MRWHWKFEVVQHLPMFTAEKGWITSVLKER